MAKKKKLRFMSCNVRSEENHQQIFFENNLRVGDEKKNYVIN